MRWHCTPDTGFEIRALAVWGRARYLSVTEAPHNTDFHTWMGKKHFCFFETAETGSRAPNSDVKGSGANHYPRAPALIPDRQTDILLTEKKSHYKLICHRNERDICTCIYKIVSLLKSYDNIHGMTYTAKIMLSGIAKIKTGYFDNINDYY